MNQKILLLRTLYAHKVSAPRLPADSQKSMAGIARKQMELVRGLLADENVEAQAIYHVVGQIKALEENKEFTTGVEGFQKLLREKDMEAKAYQLFAEEIRDIRQSIEALLRILQEQERQNSLWDSDAEKRIYDHILQLLQKMSDVKKPIREYARDVRGMRYSRGWYDNVRVISKIFNKVMHRISVEGIENVPRRGSCVIIPRHYHSILDGPLMATVIPRRVFFVSAVEQFIGWGPFKGVLYKIGAMPFKRDDSKFVGGRLKHIIPLVRAVTKEKVDAFPSSNARSALEMLNHLKHGDAIVIFPEGDGHKFGAYAITKTNEFLEPDEGFVRILMQVRMKFGMNVPIIPVGVDYRRRKIPIIGVSSPVPETYSIRVRIGKPIFLPEGGLDEEGMKNFARMAFEVVKQLST